LCHAADRGAVETYAMGYTQHELERLMFQARLLRPMTEWLLRSAGIEPGMRVLDVGSGAGDVALLAAELVGSSGSVTGIDRDVRSVGLAEHRAKSAGLTWAEFREVPVEEFASGGSSTPLSGGTFLCTRQTLPRSSRRRRGTCALAA
jgi:2-polyprenyl-3-methyl-5-hydroxy-6-metoxy-1,4-benzoquinol methylase